MHSTTASPARKKPGLLINRNYGLLWLGGTVSVFGDVIYDFTLVVWITLFLAKNQPWAPLAVSGVLMASLGTMFVLGPIAGVFVDRWDKRRTMLRMDALRVVLVALLIPATNAFPLPFLPEGRLPLAAQLISIYAIVFGATICGQFFNPAKTALIGDLVADAYRPRAAGLSQASQSIAFLLAPALAPVLALTLGVEWAIAINALSFAFSFLMIALVRAPKAATSHVEGQKTNALRELGAGLALAARNKLLSTLILAAGFVMLGAAAINALDIFFALHNLHAQPKLYGLLSTALGFGLLVGAILAGALAQRAGLVRIFTLSLLAEGVLMIAYSRLTSFMPGLIVICVAGIFQAMLNTVVAPLFLRVTPRELVGRVAALVNSTVAMAQLVGTILTGYLAGEALVGFHQAALGMTFGTFDVIIGGGGVIVLFGALYSLARLGFEDPAATDSTSATAAPAAIAPELAPEALL
jgi:MFS family permease